ncbi:MAG: metallophosphoesterase [Syntrophales bacterium LBB04]|nr:metallophosphoesterase [Syntrophales bacterium LBB04]
MNRKYTITVLIAIVVVLSIAKAYYDTNTIEIKKYQISHASLAEVLSGLKVAHLTDLHIKRTTDREKKILEILDQEKPDLIFLTGDYITFNGSYAPALSFFRQLQAPFGVYAVMGNTEYYNENGSCVLCHKEGSRQLRKKPNPIFLRNSGVEVKINGKLLSILGTDDPVTKRSDLKKSFTHGLSNKASIVLAHSPEIFSEAVKQGVDLVLSGHTHGGQLGIIKYLKKLFPLDAALEFLDGFFQEGRTLLYVNRGTGTSLLPFRFGVKPEVAIFQFKSPSGQPPGQGFHISDSSSKKIFAGFDVLNLLDMGSLFGFFKTNGSNSKGPGNTDILFDFESPADLERLNWECHKWFELSTEQVTSGKHSLKASFPSGQYPGINFKAIPPDWSGHTYFKMDVFNPASEKIRFNIRIDDHKSGWEYANRYDLNVELKPGYNPVSIPTHSIKTNLHSRSLNLKKIEHLIIFIPNNQKPRDLYIDHIRLN